MANSSLATCLGEGGASVELPIGVPAGVHSNFLSAIFEWRPHNGESVPRAVGGGDGAILAAYEAGDVRLRFLGGPLLADFALPCAQCGRWRPHPPRWRTSRLVEVAIGASVDLF